MKKKKGTCQKLSCQIKIQDFPTNKNAFGQLKTDTVFALFKAPTMQGNMHNVYFNTYIDYHKGNT